MERGYNPIYVGDYLMRETVEENGFEFLEYSIRSFCIGKGVSNASVTNAEDPNHERLKNYTEYFIRGGYFDEVLAKLDPAVIFLDYSKIVFFPDFIRRKVKLAILSTKVNLNKEPWIPPYTSAYVSHHRTLFTRILCEILWLRILMAKTWKKFLLKRRNHGFSLYDLPFLYLKAHKMKSVLKFVDHRRVANFGLNNLPEIILSPEEFDYPLRKTKPNQFYIGPCVHLERKENIDAELDTFLQRTNLVYCSMGLYDKKYSGIRVSFINKLIYAFSTQCQYNLVIATGDDIDIKHIQPAKNILVRHRLPQLEVLKNASIMITHGGMQSITESILCSVPLLVYPLNPNLDQTGNAARVQFHNVGIIGNVITDGPSEITDKVNRLMLNSEIRASTRQLHSRYVNSENFTKGMKLIEEYIIGEPDRSLTDS